jgi:hypothetical protein
MDNCYICLEKTSIYFLSKECDCKIYCHEDCIKKILKLENCIICKKNINNFSIKVEEEIEKIFILKILKKLHDNKFINKILKMESSFDLLIFVIYSLIISLLTIFLLIFILITYFGYYIYYYYKYKNNDYYVKLKINK